MKVVKVYSLKQAFKDLQVCPICKRKPTIRISNTRQGPYFIIRCHDFHRDFYFYGEGYYLHEAVTTYNSDFEKVASMIIK